MNTEDYRLLAEAKYKEIEEKYGLAVYGSRNHKDFKMVFARGRKADNENLMPTKDRFGYPASQDCNKLGRANYPKHPVMYTGESVKVIGSELGLKEDDWMHLAIYHTPDPIKFEYLLLLHDDINKKNKWHKILNEFKQFMKERHPTSHPESPEKVWQRIQSAAMAFRNNNYEETAAIAYHWLYARNIDAVLYPSLSSNDYCNFALNPNFVDNNLRLYRVHVCRWKGENIELHHTGYLESNSMVWRTTSRDDFNEFESGYSNLES